MRNRLSIAAVVEADVVRWLGVFVVVVVCLKITIDLLAVVAPKGGAIANFSKTVFVFYSFS